jgi:hypothetical protein
VSPRVATVEQDQKAKSPTRSAAARLRQAGSKTEHQMRMKQTNGDAKRTLIGPFNIFQYKNYIDRFCSSRCHAMELTRNIAVKF